MPRRCVLHVRCEHCGREASLEESVLGKRDWSPETKSRLRRRECGSRRVDARMVWEHGAPPRNVVVRVRQQGWTSVDFDIEHSYGGPVGLGRGSLPTALFARRFDRIF